MTRWSVSPASTQPIKVIKLERLEGYRLRLTFSDGAVGDADLADLAATNAPMTQPLRDLAYFARVFLEAGAPTWPNGLDIAPWALYEDLARAGRLRIARPAE